MQATERSTHASVRGRAVPGEREAQLSWFGSDPIAVRRPVIEAAAKRYGYMLGHDAVQA
jgi:hypothetical protein